MAEVETFSKKMNQNGSLCEVVSFPHEGHYFFNKRISEANFMRCLGLIGDFLASVGVGTSNPQPAEDH